MEAQLLHIERKVRAYPVVPVSLLDFQYREADIVAPRVVLEQSTISLYCLDHPHRRAIFVETPPDVDLSAAPFYYQAQYEAAQQLITAPRTVLDAMFAECRVAMSSTGALDRVLEQDAQAGSTLSRASTQASSSLSEDQVMELTRVIRHYAPTLTPDVIVPHTFLL